MEGLVYSPKQKIPLFKLVCDHQGERSVEYLNSRTACTELIKVSTLVIYLLELEMASRQTKDKGMVYSPKKKIPIGKMSFDEASGIYSIEVKYKRKKENIRFTTYVSLLLESEAHKAS